MSSRKKAAKIAPPRGSNQRGLLNGPITVDGATVFTVSVVVVVGVIVGGEGSEQVPPVMGVAVEITQLKLTVPVKPLDGVIEIVEVPESPGFRMVTGDVGVPGVATTLKSGVPVEMVIVVAEEVVEAE